MTQEDKELLLKDLCTRLPYKVIVETTWAEQLTDVSGTIGTLKAGQIEIFEDGDYSEIKPYLRPMSSMTDEECAEFEWLNSECDKMPTFNYIPINHYKIFDWLNRNHFDYRGLLEKGLALVAPKEIYNLEKK